MKIKYSTVQCLKNEIGQAHVFEFVKTQSTNDPVLKTKHLRLHFRCWARQLFPAPTVC